MNPRRRLFLITCSSFFALGCLAAVLLVLLVARGGAGTARASERRIVYGLTLMPSGFDPHINASAELGIPLRSVYDTLVYRDPDTLDVVPGLAERWEMSGDGLTYTFYLRSGVTFHDGTPFDAAAVAANLDRITNPETRSQKALFLLGPYARYEIVDARTIRLILSAPYAPFLDSLSQVYLGIASPAALAEYDRDRYQLHQVGTGPYSMVTYVPGDYMLLRRNPAYTWGPPFYTTENTAPIEEIEFRFFTDPATRAPALETGAAQIVGEIAPVDAQILARDPSLQILPVRIPGLPLQFFFNTSIGPTSNLDLRRALITGSDRVAIVDTVFQQFSPVASGPLSRVTAFYDDRVTGFYPHDLAAARRALAGVGFTDSDADGILDLGGNPLRLVMIVPAWGSAPQVAQQIQAQWRDLGVDLELRQVPNLAGLRAEVDANTYHLVAFNDFGLDASVMNTFYTTGAANNFSRYASGELDGWLARALESSLPDERQQYYSAAQGLIMDQALVLPIRDYVNLNGVSARIQNLRFDAYGWFPLLWNATLDLPANE
ncbi:MAG: hypothetical protein IT323_02185 [Anaerolineae bacterium]|nr:hypothetical protein [Anaerolineae bacterium]